MQHMRALALCYEKSHRRAGFVSNYRAVFDHEKPIEGMFSFRLRQKAAEWTRLQVGRGSGCGRVGGPVCAILFVVLSSTGCVRLRTRAVKFIGRDLYQVRIFPEEF